VQLRIIGALVLISQRVNLCNMKLNVRMREREIGSQEEKQEIKSLTPPARGAGEPLAI